MSLKQLYPILPQTDDADEVVTYVDIIAVHGLNPRSSSSHAADTWEKEGHSWLKESLPKLTPNARIWMYSYNSTVVYGKDKSSFVQKADEFLERIRVKRIEDPKRPLVLIGHSLGGLLLEQALVNAHNNPKYTHIKDATAGLAFFATPHNGGNPKLLTLGNITSKIARGTGFEQNKDVLETLKDDSIFTGILQEHWRQQILQYQIVSFWGSDDSIVSDKSAKFGTLPGNVENVVKLAGGHSDICRFNPKDDVDADNLELVLCNIKELYDIALRESAVAFNTHVLETLAFERMTAKYQRVASPHEHTFDWIFEKNGDFRPLDNHLSSMTLESDENNSFEEWMRSQTQKKSNMKNLYWIVGKAGSGKSTLMKHVFQHPKTDQSLSHWKGTSQLLKAAYFFERGQSSEERLLQTLLYQVLAHDQSIIVKVYKERWEQFSKFKDIREKRPDPPAKSKFPKFDKNGIDLDVLGLDDLFNALNRTAKLICASTKLFFLIDGLDEIVGVDESSSEDQRTAYEKCQSLSKIISEIAKNENIKICISSRPQLGFEDEEGGLEGCSRLELEKVTGPDITCYVDSQLGQSKGFAQLAKNDPQAANEICQDIKDRASGMFLWVSLVVKLLIDGINHRSRLHDLKQKVRLLPKELTGESGLYMQMLRSVGHGQYLERARIISILAQSFQIDIALSPLLLDFAEEVDAIEDLIEEKNLKKFDAERSLQRVKDRLKGCCGGIFEVRSIALLSKNGMTHDIYNDYVVDAVHGTVWEFLAEPEAAMELSKFPPDMSVLGPRTSLVRAAILSLHFIPPTVKKNRKERSKLCLDLVSNLLFAVEYSFSWNQETGEDQHALGQWEREGVQLFSKLISVFDQVGSKAHEKTRGFFESSGRHWIYLVDEKLFTYFDDYESYMISWLLEARIIFCAEYLLFDDKYKKVYNKNKSPISHAIFQYLNIESATELETRTLRRIICRLLQEKRHRTIVTSPFKEGDIRYKPLWVEIVQYNGFEPSTTAHRIRYLELLELLIENVPNLLETPLGKARNVADRLVLFDDVADKRNEIRQMIEPTLKKQESLCITM